MGGLPKQRASINGFRKLRQTIAATAFSTESPQRKHEIQANQNY